MKSLKTYIFESEDLAGIENLIGIGFCQPKFYKPSTWKKAKEVMDKLVSLNVGVIEYDFGRGKGKYSTDKNIIGKNKDFSELKKELAELYIKNR